MQCYVSIKIIKKQRPQYIKLKDLIGTISSIALSTYFSMKFSLHLACTRTMLFKTDRAH